MKGLVCMFNYAQDGEFEILFTGFYSYTGCVTQKS